MNDLKKALELLTQTIGLCHTPREMWSDTDHRIYKEAREFIQQQKEHIGESERTKTSIGTLGEIAKTPQSQRVSRETSKNRFSIETGNKGLK
jgi:hypothetical protein